ncbi:uncharacterized protein LOC128956651 [Oppia nitens]|uniref:uncharacterized protein LOC128956651 n=1 Tax=Oppia nitens TaxID=1686743 RepID=UPI0023DA165D|nr:uncharacterized protein LOC128956651 [Oppia nitens]
MYLIVIFKHLLFLFIVMITLNLDIIGPQYYGKYYDIPIDEDEYQYYHNWPQDSNLIRNQDLIMSRSVKVGNQMDINKLFDDLLNPHKSLSDADKDIPVEPGTNSRVNSCNDKSCLQCLDSCRYLKESTLSENLIIQYMYLRICAIGCKSQLQCLDKNYCLPIMKENPNYFIYCSNSSCNPFQIVPKVFRTTAYCE